MIPFYFQDWKIKEWWISFFQAKKYRKILIFVKLKNSKNFA